MRNSNTYKNRLIPAAGLQFEINCKGYPKRTVTIQPDEKNPIQLNGTRVRCSCPHDLGVRLMGIGNGSVYSDLRPHHLVCINAPYENMTLPEVLKQLPTVDVIPAPTVKSKSTTPKKKVYESYEKLSSTEQAIARYIYLGLNNSESKSLSLDKVMNYVNKKFNLSSENKEDIQMKNRVLHALYQDKLLKRVGNLYVLTK